MVSAEEEKKADLPSEDVKFGVKSAQMKLKFTQSMQQRATSREDVIKTMQTQIDEYQKIFSQFAAKKSSFMIDNALENIDQVKSFQVEVNKEAKGICAQVKALRQLFTDARGTDDNYDGYLCSNVNDYMPLLEPEFVEMNRLLDADRLHWEREARKSEDEKANQNQQMVELLSKMRTDVTAALEKKQQFRLLVDIKHYGEYTELIDMELFGNIPKANKVELRWGSLSQLISLDREDMTKPLRLEKVIHRKASSSLGGIKLVFEGGIETDALDSEFDTTT